MMEKSDSVPESSNTLYDIVHTLKDLSAGVYEARLRVKNKFGWSAHSQAISLEGSKSNISFILFIYVHTTYTI